MSNISIPVNTSSFAKIGDNISSFTNDSAFITATSATALSNKTGNISQWTNNSGYLTSASAPIKTDSVSLTGNLADINTTTFTGSGAGLYRLNYYLVDSAADLAAGAVRLNITFTDNAASQTLQSAAVLLTTLGASTQGVMIIQLASGSISYSISHTGIFAAAKYDLFITLEKI